MGRENNSKLNNGIRVHILSFVWGASYDEKMHTVYTKAYFLMTSVKLKTIIKIYDEEMHAACTRANHITAFQNLTLLILRFMSFLIFWFLISERFL